LPKIKKTLQKKFARDFQNIFPTKKKNEKKIFQKNSKEKFLSTIMPSKEIFHIS